MPPIGKYFILENQATGLVVEVPVPAVDNYIPPKTPVYLWAEKSAEEGRHGQLWYLDKVTRTLRSKVNDYCLDIEGDRLMVNGYKAGSFSQQWEVKDGQLLNHGYRDHVLDLAGDNRKSGAMLTVVLSTESSDTQKWNLKYQSTEYFYIQSKMHGKVLDIRGCNAKEGADVIAFERNKTVDDNQLWYEDENGVIRSKLNDHAPEAGKDAYIRMFPYDADNPRQQWLICGDMIRNRYNGSEVFDIYKARTWNRTPLIVFKLNGQDNQRWVFEKVNA